MFRDGGLACDRLARVRLENCIRQMSWIGTAGQADSHLPRSLNLSELFGQNKRRNAVCYVSSLSTHKRLRQQVAFQAGSALVPLAAM